VIERDLHLSYLGRCENDSEHSFQLAITAWYICESEQNSLDIEKIVKYSLIHDLVEVYAGDTPLYSKDRELIRTKEFRENKALEKLIDFFEVNKSFKEAFMNYNEKNDPESKFVYALDKLLPLINIYLDGGGAWRSHHISVEEIEKKVAPKIKEDAIVYGYYKELLKMVRNIIN
jgi:putative hydrolase of HD superfamily